MNKEKSLEQFKKNINLMFENNDKVVDKVNWENMLLKKENQELKSQLKGTTHCFDEEEHEKLKKQQKEFIKYLEDGIKQYTPSLRWKHYNEDGFNDYDVENPSCIEVQPIDKIFKEILQKYKSIIGVSDEKK